MDIHIAIELTIKNRCYVTCDMHMGFWLCIQLIKTNFFDNWK